MKPRLLLLAGMLNDERIWRPVAHNLADSAEVQVVHFAAQETMTDMAAHAWQAAGEMAAEQPLALAGFSMGGYVLQAMLANPKRTVQGVALIDSAIRPETQVSASNRLKTLEAIERDFPAMAEQVARWGTHPSRHADTGFMDGIKTMLREVGAATAARQTRAIAQRADHTELMRRLPAPVLIACGRQDKVTPPELSQEAADQIPAAELHWLEDTGHMSPLEQPEALAQLLKSWLMQVQST